MPPRMSRKKPGNIFCVALIRDHVRNGKAAAITTALTAIRMIDTGSATSILLYSDWILKPLIGAVSDYPGIDVETLADILRKRRPAIVMDAAERLAKTEGRGRAAVAREMFGGEIRRRLESEGRDEAPSRPHRLRDQLRHPQRLSCAGMTPGNATCCPPMNRQTAIFRTICALSCAGAGI